jgi:hypothetical protein
MKKPAADDVNSYTVKIRDKNENVLSAVYEYVCNVYKKRCRISKMKWGN